MKTCTLVVCFCLSHFKTFQNGDQPKSKTHGSSLLITNHKPEGSHRKCAGTYGKKRLPGHTIELKEMAKYPHEHEPQEVSIPGIDHLKTKPEKNCAASNAELAHGENNASILNEEDLTFHTPWSPRSLGRAKSAIIYKVCLHSLNLHCMW